MAELLPYRRIHLVGVAGSGMSGLAKILSQAGHAVSGSDIKPAPALLALEGAGVATWVGHRPDSAHEWDLVVASSAVPPADPELAAARDLGIEVWQRPRLLAELTALLPTIGATGTHGKTTTTAMLVTGLRSLGRDPSFMVGGEMMSFNTNAHLGAEPLFVLEADEAFGTFSSLEFRGLVVTNIEEDHLDHYGSFAALAEAFEDVARRVRGPLVACVDDPGARALAEDVDGAVGYGTARDAVWRVIDTVHGRSEVRFTLDGPAGRIPVRVPKPGDHIVLNAAGALALLGEIGLDVRAVADGLAEFGGVRRRFEVRAARSGILVVDDYAHHPTEVATTIAAARRGHDGRVIAVFQPHRFSRTLELGEHLGEALAGASSVYVTEVYAAGEAPIPGVTGRVVAEAVAAAGTTVTYVPRRQDVVQAVGPEIAAGDVVLLLGAGDISLVADELAVYLAARV